ncbi:MAG TPA: hypothetical protein VKN14_04765 [Flavobacteriaceae bacterium]|nr:hypothetical protein [Flavobacteriaceae bacterium]
MQIPRNFDGLIEQTKGLGLYKKLIIQLNKDLVLANIDLVFNEDILPTSLKLILQETINKLIQEKFTDYLNLLYIIDVSEHKIKLLTSNDTLEISEQVTFLILQREWQKVWHKYFYN